MRRSLPLPLLVAGLWAALVVAALLAQRATGRKEPTCLFKRVTGYPCATCGSTRATLALARGDVLGAAAINPLLIAGLLGLLAWAAWRGWRALGRGTGGREADGPGTRGVVPRVSPGAAAAGLVVVIAANWVYVLLRGN